MDKYDNSFVTVHEALQIILGKIQPLDGEEISIFDALGRSLFHDVVSDINIPPVDNSAMDGYAVVADDIMKAQVNSPAVLPVAGEVKAGDLPDEVQLSSGSAVRIMTGAPVPNGSDTVVQFEDTCEKNGTVHIYRKIGKGENIRRTGEDIRKGLRVFSKGHRIDSADTGVLASLNYKTVTVFKQPRIAIISTGDEIAEIGAGLKPGHIRNSNAYTLYSEIKKYNGVPFYLGIAKDTREETIKAVSQAMEYDILITTGGVSKGHYDFVRDAVTELGFSIHFENIKMKPGKPCVFGTGKGVLFFGLPGNPVSTMVSFIQFVRPAILRMMGVQRVDKPLVKAEVLEDIRKKPGRIHFVRGYYTIKNGKFRVTTTGSQGSGILRSMSIANCLIIVPSETELVRAGEQVTIQLIHHEEL